MDILKQLHHGLIVSCQAKADSPLRDSRMMAAMAQAAEQALTEEKVRVEELRTRHAGLLPK